MNSNGSRSPAKESMEKETVEELEKLTTKLANLIVNMEPKLPQEWEAMEKMQAAHKQLRSIDLAELTEREQRASSTR